MLLGFLIGGAVAIVGALAGGGMVMLASHMDRRASADPNSFSGRLTKSLEMKDRDKKEEQDAKAEGRYSDSLLRR